MSYYLMHKIRDIRSLIKFIIDTLLNNLFMGTERSIGIYIDALMELKLSFAKFAIQIFHTTALNLYLYLGHR